MLTWIDTDVMVADCLTKAMDTELMRHVLASNTWDTSQPLSSRAKKAAKQLARSKKNNFVPLDEKEFAKPDFVPKSDLDPKEENYDTELSTEYATDVTDTVDTDTNAPLDVLD